MRPWGIEVSFMSSRTQFKILIKIGDQVQSFMIDKKSFTVGRSKNADLQIPYDYLSNLHFRFEEISKNIFAITDLGSTNGTCLKNISLIPQKPTRYEAGEEILIKVQKGIRLKIIPLEVSLPESSELKKLTMQIEKGKEELTKITEMIKTNQEAYLMEKESHLQEILKIEEEHKNLQDETEKLILEKMDEGLKVVLIRDELTKLSIEKEELKDVVETQYKALKLMTQKSIDTSEMLSASESSLQKMMGELNEKSLEYSTVSHALESARTEYEQLKHTTDILNIETKKLVDIYQVEKEQFDSVMEEKRKTHMEELNKQLENYNDEALKKKTELDYLKTEYDLRQKAYDDNLRRHEQREKEKSDLELKRQTAQMTTELLHYRSELKNIEKHYKNKLKEQELALDEKKRKFFTDLENEIHIIKESRVKAISEETHELEKIKTEKEESIETLKVLRTELNKQQEALKEFLNEMNRQRNEAISQAESETDKEIRTMKFKKVQELSEQIGHHIAKDLMIRRGRALDDEYIEKSSVAIKRLIVEKMLESHDVDTERTRQLVLGDELKKFRNQGDANKFSATSIVASVAALLFVLLSAAVIYPEAVLVTKKIVLEKIRLQKDRLPASNP